jgi:hypothetical protein
MPKRKGKSKKEAESPSTDAADELDAGTTDTADEFETESTDVSEPEPASVEDTPEPPNAELDSPVPAPEPIPEKKPESEPSPQVGLSRIPLRVFEKIAGTKWDQLAGFKHYAKANGLGPMTVPEWREALQAYKRKPTK